MIWRSADRARLASVRPVDRVAPARRQAGQRPEHEGAIEIARVRHRQPVVVESAGRRRGSGRGRGCAPPARPAGCALAPPRAPSSTSSSACGVERRPAHGHGVEVVGLRVGHLDRGGLFERRGPQVGEVIAERVERPASGGRRGRRGCCRARSPPVRRPAGAGPAIGPTRPSACRGRRRGARCPAAGCR